MCELGVFSGQMFEIINIQYVHSAQCKWAVLEGQWYIVESTYFKFAPQAALQFVLFVPVNLAGQRFAGQASPFTGTVFER